jgi:hypothetical protein
VILSGLADLFRHRTMLAAQVVGKLRESPDGTVGRADCPLLDDGGFGLAIEDLGRCGIIDRHPSADGRYRLTEGGAWLLRDG